MTTKLSYADMTDEQREREHLRHWAKQPTAKRLAALERGVYDLHDCEANNCKFHERTVARLRFIVRVVASLVDAEKRAALMAVLDEWDAEDSKDLALNEFPTIDAPGLVIPDDRWFDQPDQNPSQGVPSAANKLNAQ